MTSIEIQASKPRVQVVAAIVAAIAIGVLPLYAAELKVLLGQSMYQFFPLVYGFAIYVGWNRWEEAEGTRGPRAGYRWWSEYFCIAFAFSCLVVHAGLFGPWLGGAAGLATVAAGVFALARLRNIQLWDLWLLLVISSRLPLNLNGKLAESLQALSSQLSSLALDAFGVVHVLAGNVVQLPQGELFVAEACSGVVSVMSVIACAAVLAIWTDLPWLRSIALIAFGVGYAMLMNAGRITIIALARAWFDIDLSHGWVHQVLGILVFLVTCACLLSTDYLLMRLMDWYASGSGERGTRRKQSIGYRMFPSPPRPSRTGATMKLQGTSPIWIGLACLGVLLGVYHSFALYTSYKQDAGLSVGVVALAKDWDRSAIDAAVAPWKVVSEDLAERDVLSELAPFSKIYRLKHPAYDTELTLSIDFPFYRKWHDVTFCYERSGWEVAKKETRRDKAPKDIEDCQYIAAEFTSPTEGYGHLVFCNVNHDGRIIIPPAEFGDFGYLVNHTIHLFQQPRQVSLNPNKLFQVQVFSTASKPQSEDLKQEMEQIFFRTFREVRSFLASARERLPE